MWTLVRLWPYMCSESLLLTDMSATNRLAARLEQDMRRRGVGPGDRYLTAAQAGNLFRVSLATANSAMCILAERKLLIRRRNSGSFGGPKLKSPVFVGGPTIYVLWRSDLPEGFEHIHSDEMIKPLRAAMGRTRNIQLCFLSEGHELSHVRQVIRSAQDSASPFGVIACSCPCEVYQYLIENGVPTVVLGTPYAGQDDLPSIDYDHMQGGRLLMEYLIRRGHDRAAVLFLAHHRPGDNDFLDGLHDAMSRAQLLPNALRVRTIPSDPLAVAAAVERLMTQPDRPTAVIAMFEQIGEITIDVASRMGFAVPRDLEVVFRARRPQAGKRLEHTQLRHAISPDQFCEQAGAMLDRLWRVVPLEQKRVVIPAELFEREVHKES